MGDEQRMSSSHILNAASNYSNYRKFYYFFSTTRNLHILDETLLLNLILVLFRLNDYYIFSS